MRKAAAFCCGNSGACGPVQRVCPDRCTDPRASAEASRRCPASEVQAPLTQGAAQLTADDVNAWLDGYMPIAIGRGDIPAQSWSS